MYEITKRAEISPQRVYRFQSGERWLTQDTLEGLFEALDLEAVRRGDKDFPEG